MSRKKTKEIDLEKTLLPECGKLKIENGLASAKILDEELDILDCTFGNDGCVEINTSELSYIILSRAHLDRLMELIDEAEEFYDSDEFQNQDEENA